MKSLNIRPHKNLKVWQKSMDLVTRIYGITKGFPKDEEFGLKSQLRRAAISVPSNIAEGLARRSNQEKLHFLSISQGSLSEIDTQIEIAQRLSYIGEKEENSVISDLTDIQMLLSGLSRSIR